jgi:L-threonine-O-3-phosphate decarboxylase
LDILDFSASINPLGPPRSAIAAIQAHLSDLRHYPNPNYQELREAIAAEHGLDPDWVLPGNGSAELLTWAGRELACLSATYLPTPAFGDYRRALQAFGATVIECPLELGQGDEEGKSLRCPSAQEFNLLLPSSRADGGLVINTPHNPSGMLFELDAILPLLPQFALVVVDEAFMDFLPPAQQQSLIDRVEDFSNLVILRSLTKFYSLPGLRLGYAIAQPDRLQRWQQWRDPWAVNVLAEAAALAVLADRTFQQQTWEWLPTARSQLFQGLSALPGLHPLSSAANFLLVRSDYSTVDLQRQLLQHQHILIRDCTSFQELGDRYFRVAVRTPAENQRLLDGLAAILTAYVL